MAVNLTKEKIFFTRHLYIMIKGGFLVSEAIELLKGEVKSKKFKLALDDIVKRLLEGESLNKSISRHPNVFGRFYQNIIRIGEESGSLENNLKYLANQLSADYEIKKKITGAMLYPLIVIVLALIIAFVVTIFILPKILNIFSVLDVKLPMATIILISGSTFFQKNWIFVIAGIFLVILIYKILRRFL